MLALHQSLESLQTAYTNLRNDFNHLHQTPDNETEVAEAVECCLRSELPLGKCVFCKCEQLLMDYESKLFCFDAKSSTSGQPEFIEGVGECCKEDLQLTLNIAQIIYCVSFTDGTVRFFHTRKGTWIDSETEVALKTLVSALKTFGARKTCLDAGVTHLKLLDALKKEFKHLRHVWMLLKEQVILISL